MATAVTISIVVDSAQAQAAIGALNKAIEDAGVKGDVAFKRASQGVKDLGGHAATALDGVRLLSQEFGLRLPRALEAMISRSQGLSTAIQGVVGGLAVIAGIEVFAHLIKGSYDLYHNYIDLNAAADEYYKTLQKTREADFGGARTIETQMQRFTQATRVAAQLKQQADDLHAKGIDELTNPNNMDPIAGAADLAKARELADQAAKAAEARNDSAKNGLELTHQQKLAEIDLQHAGDVRLQTYAKINAETAKKIAIDKEDRRYTVDMERAAGNVNAPDAGAAEQSMKDQQAIAEGNAQKAVLARDSSLAMMKYHDEMIQSNLRGEELYQAKVTAIYNETLRAEINAGKVGAEAEAAALAARTKMEREHADQQKEQMRAAQEELAKASMTGLSPVARANAEYASASTQIKSSVADGRLSPDAAKVKEQAAALENQKKILELQQQFTERMKALDDGRVANAVQGYAKIAAEEQKRVNAANEEFDKTFGGANAGDPSTIAARKATDDAITQIHASANAQRQELDQKNADETLRYNQQAAEAEKRVKEDGLLGFVAAYKNSIQAINQVDADRRKKVEEELASKQISESDAQQRKIAIDRTANAQIAEQNAQMQHQIAGDLQAAFTNPVDFIKNAMEKMFFEIVASWVMKMDSFKAIFGNTMGGLQPGVGGDSAGTGGLLSKLAHGAGGAFSSGTQQGGYTTGSSTSAGVTGGGSTIAGGGTSSSSFGGTLSGVGSLAQVAANIPGLGGAFGGAPQAPAAMTTDESAITDMIPNAPMPGVSPTLASIGGFGDPTTGGNSGMSTAMGALGAGMGAYTAGQTTVQAYESGNVLSGALGDAAAGAAIGSVIPGVGTAIGAGVGAAVGAAAGLIGMIGGEGAKLAARDYYNKSVFPQLNAAATNSNYGDFQTAISSVNSTSAQAMMYMRGKFGAEAANWVNDNYMKKEVQKADSMISNSAEGGRQFTQMSAMQFHTGGTISGFGSFATSDNEGFIHAAMGETVMTPGASAAHGPALAAMNAGASAADVAGAYLGSTARSSAMPGSSGDTHFHVHTLDTKTMSTWLRDSGARMITKAQNDYNARYAGDGISG